MNKKRIGIDINEVIRMLWNQFDKYYIEEFGDEYVKDELEAYTMDFWNNYHWEDKEETINYLNEDLPENISPLEYQVDEKTGISPVDHMAFRKKTEMIPARDVYKRFLYEDFCLEIFGMANGIYRGIDRDIEKFYIKYKDQFELSIVSKENWFTIAPTLFFLSKLGIKFKHYHLVEENAEIWDKVDVLITANPELLENVPEGKQVVKIIRPFNKNIDKVDFEEYNLINLVEVYVRDENDIIIETINNDEFDKFIGYIMKLNNNKENE